MAGMHLCYTVIAGRGSSETTMVAEFTTTMSQQTLVTDTDSPTVTADVTIVTDLQTQTGMYICIHVLGGGIRPGWLAIQTEVVLECWQ